MSMTKKDYTALAAIIKAAMTKGDTFYTGPANIVRTDAREAFRFISGWKGATHEIADNIADHCMRENPRGFDKAEFMRNAGIDTGDSPAPAYESSRMLECSTAHMTREDTDLLNRGSPSEDEGINLPLLIGYFEEGYFVRLTLLSGADGHGQREMRKAGFSREFISFCTWAHAQGFVTILFDRDAERIAGQTAFEW